MAAFTHERIPTARAALKASSCIPNLILRSAQRVSKDGNEHRVCCRPFETRPFGARSSG